MTWAKPQLRDATTLASAGISGLNHIHRARLFVVPVVYTLSDDLVRKAPGDQPYLAPSVTVGSSVSAPPAAEFEEKPLV